MRTLWELETIVFVIGVIIVSAIFLHYGKDKKPLRSRKKK